MANQSHLEQLRQSVKQWNEWIRLQRLSLQPKPTRHDGAKVGVSGFWPDLEGADLPGVDLYQGQPGAGFTGIDLIGADLRAGNLQGVNLAWANLTGATLEGADLTAANLMNARLEGATLADCNLRDALLGGANLLHANFGRAQLNNAYFAETNFTDTNLTGATGLNYCRYGGPCTVDHRTLLEYAPLPRAFLRGCGVPEILIDYLPSLITPAIHHSCFISYSSLDEESATRIYEDLQENRVRCWFAPHNLPIGAKTWDAIDQEIHVRDKLLLILSQNSIYSDWVEDEVSKAFAEERDRKQLVLFPIRIDDSVMTTTEPWAAKLRDQRNIGDFRHWKDDNKYKAALERLLRDLRAPLS